MTCFARSGVWFFVASFLFVFAAGCSRDSDRISVAPSLLSQRRRPALDARTNPLQTYIRDTWTGGNNTATGGLHYSHIKLYGHNYMNIAGGSPPCTNATADINFVAQHFDAYMWGGEGVGAGADPDMLWFQEAGNIPHIRTGWDTDNANAWIANPTENPNGYDWFDLALHYQINTSNGHSTVIGIPYFPGWNPDDDTDGDGCIEPGEGNNGLPSDPNRSAVCVSEARVLMSNFWIKSNVAGPAYADFVADVAKDEWANGIDGFHFDEAAWENQGNTLTNTFQYWQQNEDSPSFSYIEDRIALPSAVMADVESYVGHPIVAFANMVSATYAAFNQVQKGYALTYLENLLLETWLANSGVGLAKTYKRWAMLDDMYTDYLSAGKGVVFTCYDDVPSERMKLFSLAMFYMINHQMAFYYYRTQGHSGCDVSTWQWNPWVEYDVGQPIVNTLGLQDFEGQAGTNRFFVFATDPVNSPPHYEVLGRQYERSDGKKVLVLAKLMADGQTQGANPTSIALGATYKKVQSDFTLGPAISSVTLANNEGVILIRQTGGGCRDCDPDG